MVERRRSTLARNPNRHTVESIRKYLTEAREGFVDDPPQSQYQVGFKACVDALWEDLFMTTEERKLSRRKVAGNS